MTRAGRCSKVAIDTVPGIGKDHASQCHNSYLWLWPATGQQREQKGVSVEIRCSLASSAELLLGETATETAGFLLHLSPSTHRGEQAALLAHRPYRTHTPREDLFQVSLTEGQSSHCSA